jgi:hypothetical protein
MTRLKVLLWWPRWAWWSLVERLAARLIAGATRKPDIVIGGEDSPYLRRWYVIPRNRVFNIYLHQFMRSDDDRALHDHPWASVSIMLRGFMLEVLPLPKSPRWIERGRVVYRSAKFAHRLVIPDGLRGVVWTLFITGPVVREWGFHCPQGWRHWRAFTAGERGETIGRGCA